MIVPLTLEHALAIAGNLREWDRREVSASIGHTDYARWARDVVAMPGQEGLTVLAADGEPVAMGGAVVDGDRAIVWFVATDRIHDVGIDCNRLALRTHRAVSGRVRLCAAMSLDGHRPGRDWLQRLGYLPLVAMTHNGQAFTMMGKQMEGCHV